MGQTQIGVNVRLMRELIIRKKWEWAGATFQGAEQGYAC